MFSVHHLHGTPRSVGLWVPFTELVIDCKDPGRVAEFWAAVLGYDVVDRGPNGEIEIGHGTRVVRLAPPSGSPTAGRRAMA